MTKYRFATKPRPYQVPALRHLVRNKGGALQVPKRYGKTKLAIDFAGMMAVKYGARSVLVLCPANVLSVWPDEIVKHAAVRSVLINDEGEPTALSAGLHGHWGDGPLRWRVVNFESSYARVSMDPHNPRSKSPMSRHELENHDILIIDESHAIGNPTAVQAKMAYLYSKTARFVVIMTGSMFARKPIYVFGQFKVIDEAIFGTNWGSFKEMICIEGGRSGREILGYRNLDWMMDQVRPWVFEAEEVPTSPPVHQLIRYDMDRKERDLYDEMERESAIIVDDELFTAPLILTKHLRLMQIIGGWMKRADGGYRRLGRGHRRMFAAHLKDMSEQDITKLVVACRFVPEFYDVAFVAKRLGYDVLFIHGAVGKGEPRRRRIHQFQTTERPTILIAQPQTAREGIDLSAASNMIWYSLPESYVTYDQMSARIKLYDEKRTLGYDYIMANHSRAMLTYEALQVQQDVAKYIMKNPKRVEEIVRLAAKKRSRRK